MADENLDITLEAHATGVEVFAEMKAALDVVRDAVVEKAAVSRLGTDISAEGFEKLRTSIEETAAAQLAAVPVTDAATASNEALFKGFGGWIPIIGSAVQAYTGWIGALAGMGPVGVVAAAVLVGIGVDIVGVASSFLLAAAAATTFITATVAGFTSVAGAAALALGPIALLGAGITVLGLAALGTNDVATATKNLDAAQQAYNATQGITVTHAQQVAAAHKALVDAQNAYNAAVAAANSPVGQFEQGLGNLKDTLGQQALPLLQQLATFASTLLPIIQQLGSELITWFGSNLPTVLAIAHSAINPMVEGFNKLGVVVGDFIQEMFARMPAVGTLMGQMQDATVAAVKGLLDNLLRFVDWFIKEWPLIRPVAQEVMDAVGRAIQEMGKIAANLVEWFIQNWPEIKHTVEDLKPVWQALGDLVWVFANAFVGAMKVVEGSIWVLDHIRNAAEGAWDKINALRNILGNPWPVPGPIAIGGGGGGNIAAFDYGGMVPGPLGAPQLAIVHGGERVLTPEQQMGRDGNASWQPTRVYNVTQHISGGFDAQAVGNAAVATLLSALQA